jgi:CPA2 family monovalent cation:H+ antiporter-2
MPEHDTFPFLREILLFLTLTGILIPTLQKLRINPVLGFLVVGAVVGPLGVGRLAHDLPLLAHLTFPAGEGVEWLGELGVMFMMFMIGLELSAARLWAMRHWVFGAGCAQVALTALIVGAVTFFQGEDLYAALIVGMALAFSSTAVVMQLMQDSHETDTPVGKANFSVLMFQDLMVVPLLILVGTLSHGTRDGLLLQALLAMLKAAVAIFIIFKVGGRIVHPVFQAFARHRQPDVFMALILLATFGIASLSASFGLSMALGALIAGLLLAETEFRHEIELMIDPFKGLLMGLFFMTVGMRMDARQMLDMPLWLGMVLVGLVAVKALIITVVYRSGRMSWGQALHGGLLMAQGGEFAFIVLAQASQGKVIDAALANGVTLAVALSLFITPLLARVGRGFDQRWEDRHGPSGASLPDAGEQDARGRIIIAGFGRVGQQLARLLRDQGQDYIALENDARLVAKLHARGVPVFYGNAARAELLKRLHADQAHAIVLTMDHPGSALHALHGIRREFPSLPVFVRSRDQRHARALKQAGATLVVHETLEVSLQLSASVLESLGVDPAEVDRIIDDERDQFLSELPDGPTEPEPERQRRDHERVN